MILGLHHASLTTADLDRLVAFYCELMGFEVVLETSWAPGNGVADAIFALKDTAVRMAMLRTSNAFLEIFEFSHPLGRPGDPRRPVCDAGLTHVCLAVDDLDAEYARLGAAGVTFHCPPQDAPGIGRATYARDPDGNIVELLQPDPAGPFAWAGGGPAEARVAPGGPGFRESPPLGGRPASRRDRRPPGGPPRSPR